MSSIATIRKARRSDITKISDLSRAEIESGLPPSWRPARVAQILQRPDTNAYISLCNNQLTGFTIASLGQERMHLLLHAVSPAMRCRGLGRNLLQWQIDAALVAGITEAILEVRALNTQAQAFYRKLYFEPYRVIPKYYSNREDAICMRRTPIYRTA